MHDFKFKKDSLFCEKVRVGEIAHKVGTPFYLYSYKTLTDHFLKLKRAFAALKPLICYSVKANPNLTLIKCLLKKGAGLDIVSGGELFIARRAGCPGKKIVYAGVGKTEKEIEEAIRTGILLFNVESLSELDLLNRLARVFKKRLDISLRINPGLEVPTHQHITTGGEDSKFGLDLDSAYLAFCRKKEYEHLNICGLHVHIGSQIIEGEPFVKAFRKVLIFMLRLEKEGFKIKYLNLGGGLGIIYHQEKPQTAQEFADRITPLVKDGKYKIILEPGRFIVGNAGIFVTKVLYVKKTKTRNFVIVDGSMSDLLRPALYDAYHELWPLECAGREGKFIADVVGPVCESSDFLARQRILPPLEEGELVAFLGTGAYGFAMSSNYNSRPRACEVLVKGSKFTIIRKRESYLDLIAHETIPEFVK